MLADNLQTMKDVLMLYLLCAVNEAVVLSTLSYQEAWEMVSMFL